MKILRTRIADTPVIVTFDGKPLRVIWVETDDASRRRIHINAEIEEQLILQHIEDL